MNEIARQGYYTIKHDHSSEYYINQGFKQGQLAYVVPGHNKIHVIIGEMEFTYDETELEEFENDFEYDPDGATKRQEEVSQLMQDVICENQYNEISHELLEFNPNADDIDKQSTEPASTALSVRGANAVRDLKKTIAETRNLVLKNQKSLKSKTEKLKLILKEQSRALELKAKELEDMMGKAEEAIWTINLYLGKNEEIHRLATGKPAPKEVKITLRQRVLFMDEECGMVNKDGGIDIHDIESFDKWVVADPKNIDKIIPEEKGIVALHIRRHIKDYQNPWLNAELNKANVNWTYFLIRNGQNIYRVFVDLVLGKDLFPSESEYDNIFSEWSTDFDVDPPVRTKVYLKPGSKKYMDALESANATYRHYLRVVLVLQGLLDRTTIFKPMPVERINICNVNECSEYINMVYDNELENLLPDGKPLFTEWQKSINNKLEVGHRIIGSFRYQNLNGGQYEDSRIYPARAKNPDSMVLYTIEKSEIDKDRESFIILYERTGEIVYRRYERPHEASVRARCRLYKDDLFILNFDAAELADMEYYINSRKKQEEL